MPKVKKDGEFATEKRFVRFTAWTVAEIEQKYDAFTLREPVMVPAVTSDGEPVTDADGQPMYRDSGVSRQNTYYGHDGFAKAMERYPYRTVIEVLALIFEEDEKTLGAKMLPGYDDDYGAAVGVAWAMSQGVDPTVASRMLAEGVLVGETKRGIIKETAEAILAEQTTKPGSPIHGENGSESGQSASDEALASSGS